MALRAVRPRAGLTALLLWLPVVAGCSRGESAKVGKTENPQTWAPEKLTSVQGVPATDIEEILSHLRDEWEQDHATYKYYIAYAQKPDEPVRNE